MKIEELLYEADGSPTKAALKTGATTVAKNAVKGAGEFIKGVRGNDVINPLTGKSAFAYGDDVGAASRGMGRDVAPEQRFNKLMNLMYGNNINPEIKTEWEDALKSKDARSIQLVNKKYRELLRQEAKDTNNKLKDPNKRVIADLGQVDFDKL